MTATAMFPLGTVLFPHMPLPLRLFEPRYLRMLADLWDSDDPEFAVVLIERGHEVGGGDQRFGVGTIARVVEVAAHEGYMAIMSVGTQRVQVMDWLGDEPYPRAETESLPDLEWQDSCRPLFEATEEQVRSALMVSTSATWPADVQLADDPLVASWQLAAIAPVGPLDQLTLLQASTVEELLETTGRLATETIDVADW